MGRHPRVSWHGFATVYLPSILFPKEFNIYHCLFPLLYIQTMFRFFSPSSSVLQCDWYVFMCFVGSWFSCNSTCFVCAQLLSIFFEAKGNFEYLAAFLPIPHIALYNHIQSTGGRCWYVSRVLSQGYPTFPFDKPLFLGLDINKALGAETM